MLPLNYATLDYHSIEILCFRYNELAGVSFLLQQCIALNDFSEGLSNYRIIGYSDYRALGLLGFRTMGPSDYWDFGLLGRHRLSVLSETINIMEI
jgi:hypothetical protein